MHHSESELRRFLAGRLSEAAAEGVARHLETCATCESRIQQLEAEQKWTTRDADRDELLDCLAVISAGADSTTNHLEQAARSFVVRLGRLPGATLVAEFGAPPDQFGEYRLGPLLGRGGMGLVFQAHHRTLDRVVAVKFLPPRLDSSTGGRERFLREARAMAKLRHARLVSALDAGCEGAWTYLVMELLSGIDFERLSRRVSPLPVSEACELIRQTAEGLDALHGHGLVHRDLKPSNLMLVAQPSGPPVVKILDLGLSRWLPDGDGGDSELDRLTVEGQWLGTLDYVAPEQLRDARQASPAADLYSLGATFHSLLTGRPIWSTDRGDPLPTRVARRLLGRPELAWDARPELPRDLIQLTEQLLAFDPAHRPTTEQVIARLKRWAVDADLSRLYRTATNVGDVTRDDRRLAGGEGADKEENAASRPHLRAPRPMRRALERRRWMVVATLAASVAAATLALTLASPNIRAWLKLGDPARGEPGSSAAGKRVEPTAADRRAALHEVLKHGGRVELVGIDSVVADAQALPEEIPAVWNLTIRGADWPELSRQKLTTLLENVGEVRRGLWLEAVDVDADALSEIGRLESLAMLQVFVVEHCGLTDPGDLSSLRHVEQTGFPHTNLSDEGLRRLLTLPQLKALDVSATRISDDGLLALAHIPFRQLVVRDNRQLTDRSLAKLAENEALESLTLSGTQATDAALAPLAGRLRLDGLYLADTAITDQGLATIVSLSQLNYLALNNTRVTAQGVSQLTSLPLHDLWLNELRCVDDDVLKRIAEIRTLKNLSLTRTAITDRGVQELRRLPELRLLFLTGTQVSDESVASLAECRQLRTVYLIDTSVTSAGCSRLRELLPGCNVIFP